MIDLESRLREALSADADRAPDLPAVWDGPTVYVVSGSRRGRHLALAIAVAALVVATLTLVNLFHVLGGGESQRLGGVPTTVSDSLVTPEHRARELQDAAEREAETQRARQLQQLAERAAQQAAQHEAQGDSERLPRSVTVADLVTFGLPADAVPDTGPAIPPPASTSSRWLVPNRSSLTFVAQTIEPLIPSEQLIVAETIGGLTWRLYDVGPSDGSTIVAVSHVSSDWIVVTAQDWSSEVRGDNRQLLEEIVKSARLL